MSLSLDGTPVAAGQSSTTITLTGFTTTAGSGEIVVCILSNAASVVSVTATGLTFTARNAYSGGFGFSIGAVYTAPYTTNFSGTITVTLASATGGRGVVFAVGGANTSTPFDSGGPQNNNGTGAPSITTTNANDFVYTSTNTSLTTTTAGTGWTLISSAGGMLVEYQIVSATGTYTTTIGGGTLQGSIIDAIVQGVIVPTSILFAQACL